MRRGGDLDGVARIDHREAGDHTHQREILDRLVRAAVARREARRPAMIFTLRL